ncbi:MAG: hypothetical protein ACJAXH_003226, partial [Colwellia sp.]
KAQLISYDRFGGSGVSHGDVQSGLVAMPHSPQQTLSCELLTVIFRLNDLCLIL